MSKTGGNAMIDIKHLLKSHAYQNIPLTYEEAYELGLYALKGCKGDEMAQKQSIAVLCALHTRATYAWKKTAHEENLHEHKLPDDAAEQIAGICAAIFEHDIAISENGFVDPDIECVMDNCGMGGDLVVTSNVSTLAGFIAAASGISMCKHGSPSNADKGLYGSSDFISLVCGINNFASREQVEKCIERLNFAYTDACDMKYKRIHMQTHQIAMLPHMNDIIGPITNPLNPQKVTKRVVGINHLISPCIVAKAYKVMNTKGVTNLTHGLFVRGFSDKGRYEGMDEVSICAGGTRVVELKNGKINEFDLYAKDFGIEDVLVEQISPSGDKGEFSLKILKGEISGPPLQMVLANAAILFYLAGKSKDLKECYIMAEKTHAIGKAYKTMISVQKELSI
jgi:anthranilate phosphoribosyltransferase